MFSNIEQSIFYFFNHTLSNPVCDAIIAFFMKIPGQFVLVFIVAAAFFLGKKYLKGTSLILLASFTVGRYVYKAVKYFVHRPRPFHILEDVHLVMGPKDGFSFPSGHATTSFCVATVVAIRYPKLSYPAFIIATLVALSRPYIGVHYPSDILVGSLLGVFVGYFVTKTANKCLENNSRV